MLATAEPAPALGATVEPAPAKVNLDLLVTGRREDGYHELDSLVVFTALGDSVELGRSGDPPLVLRGPRSPGLPVEDNLVARAARAFADVTGQPVRPLVLDKRLPVAAGLGGGSADAAAALRLLDRSRPTRLGPWRLAEIGASIGSDLPACVHARTVRMRGRGERLDPVTGLPELWLVLANPGVELLTGPVFAALKGPGEPRCHGLKAQPGFAAFVAWLTAQRNDLEPAAIGLCPPIASVLAALGAQPGCALARMTGSGPTCFALFADAAAAERAAAAIARAEPGWWVRATAVCERPRP